MSGGVSAGFLRRLPFWIAVWLLGVSGICVGAQGSLYLGGNLLHVQLSAFIVDQVQQSNVVL